MPLRQATAGTGHTPVTAAQRWVFALASVASFLVILDALVVACVPDPRDSLPAFGYDIQEVHAAVAYGLIVLFPAGDETSAITGCGDQLHAGPFRAARTCPASQVAIPFRVGAGLHCGSLPPRRERRLHAICVDERTDHDQA